MTPTQLEHRLTAALSARAEQVTAADLRPPMPPTGVRIAGRRWLVASVALAAAVLALAVFVVIGQVREQPLRPSHQPGTASPSSTAEPTPIPASRTAAPTPSVSDGAPIPATPDGPVSAESSPPETPSTRAGVRIDPRTGETLGSVDTTPAPSATRTAVPEPAETTPPS